MIKKLIAVILLGAAMLAACACTEGADREDNKVDIYAANHLQAPLEELEQSFEAANPDLDMVFTFDTAENLQEMIEEGQGCDVLFIDSQAPMDSLQRQGFLIEGSRKNVINDQLILFVKKGEGDESLQLAGLSSLDRFAMLSPGTAAGQKTCLALAKSGYLDPAEDLSAVSEKTLSKGLGGCEPVYCESTAEVLSAVEDGSCQAGIVQLSDIYGHLKTVKIVEAVSYDLTGSMYDPMAAVSRQDESGSEGEAVSPRVQLVMDHLSGDEAAAVYDRYLLSTDLSVDVRPWVRKACPCCSGALPQGDQ